MEKNGGIVDVPRVSKIDSSASSESAPGAGRFFRGPARAAVIGAVAVVVLVGAAVFVGATVKAHSQPACNTAMQNAMTQLTTTPTNVLKTVAIRTADPDPNSVYVARYNERIAVVGSGRFECIYCNQNASSALQKLGWQSETVDRYPTTMLVCSDKTGLDLGRISKTVAKTLEDDPANPNKIAIHTVE